MKAIALSLESQVRELDTLLNSSPWDFLGKRKEVNSFVQEVEDIIEERIECGELCEDCYIKHGKQVETNAFRDGLYMVAECPECDYTFEYDPDHVYELINSNEIV